MKEEKEKKIFQKEKLEKVKMAEKEIKEERKDRYNELLHNIKQKYKSSFPEFLLNRIPLKNAQNRHF